MRDCANCPADCETRISGKGSGGGIVIVTDTASKMGMHKLLKEVLVASGVGLSDPVYITAAAPCKFEAKSGSVPAAVWRSCRNGVLAEIIAQRPRKILLCGGAAISQFFGKQTSVKSVRGRAYGLSLPYGNILAVPTWSPQMIMANPDLFRDFAYDVAKLVREDSVYPEPKTDLIIAETRNDIRSALNSLRGATRVSSDLETTSIKTWEANVLSVGFCALYDEPGETIGTSLIIPEWSFYEHGKELVRDFLEKFEGETSFHNAAYDMSVFRRVYNRKLRVRNLMDTMLMASALDERGAVDEETSETSKNSLSQGHSLKTLSRVRYDAPDYEIDFDEFHKWRSETLEKGDVKAYRERMRSELFPYHAKDLVYTALLRNDLGFEIERENPRLMTLVREVNLPAAIAFGYGEFRGVDVNREKFESLSKKLEEDIARSLADLQRFGIAAGIEEFNPNSSAQVSTIIYDYFKCKPPKSNQQSFENRGVTKPTDKVAIAALQVEAQKDSESDNEGIANHAKERLAFFELLLECKQKQKAKSTYVDKALAYSEGDGRIHPSLSVTSTATGRTSARGYGVQTIPAGDDGSRSSSGVSSLGQEIREAFEAPPGYVYMEADYSQAQVRIAGWLSNDEKLLGPYREGKDFYRLAGSEIYRKTEEAIADLERQASKVVVLGTFFGRGAESLVSGFEMDLLVRQGFKRWSVPQAEKFISNFLGGFPAFKQWREDQLSFALENQYVETITGRRRRFPLISDRRMVNELSRLSVNTPIQGTEFDIIAQAIKRISKRLPEEVGELLFIVHDSGFLIVKEDRVLEAARIVKACMEPKTLRDCIPDYPNDIDPVPVPLPVGIKFGKNWGSMKKVEL